MMKFSINKKYNRGQHFLFWISIWVFYIFFFSYNSEISNYILAISTYLIPITAIATYTIEGRLIPKYLNDKKYIQFGIYTFISLLFTTFCILLFLIVSVSFIPEFKTEDLPSLGKNYTFIVLLVYLIVALVSFASLWKKNTQIAMRNKELQNEIITAKFKTKEQELAYLKNQIHPHFLFNTLNTIYGFALKKSEDTPEIILKLSSLLDYILYQTNKQEVSLIEELKHIEDYIDLERIRFKDTLSIIFTKEIETQVVKVAPMLLLPFVENAFKHGTIINGFLNVIMDISVSETELNFKIKNTFTPNESRDGLGLKNIKERLELLYPENYDLKIDKTSDWYEVHLKLKHVNHIFHG